MKQAYVYILTNKRNGTLYVGVTSDLVRRVYEHKQNFVDGFTKKYHVYDLVYYEAHKDIQEAIIREKQIKKWNCQSAFKTVPEIGIRNCTTSIGLATGLQ